MNYHSAENVSRPADVDFKKCIHDNHGKGDDYSVALLSWNGKEYFAVRWNIRGDEKDDPEKQNGEMCLGFPSSHGLPTWFEIPEDLIDSDSEVYRKMVGAKKSF